MSEKTLGKKVSEDPFIHFLREKIFIRKSGISWFTFGLHFGLFDLPKDMLMLILTNALKLFTHRGNTISNLSF